jgi:transposase
VVLRAIEAGMSPREAATAHGIKNSGTVRTWVRQAKTENAELYTNLPLVNPKEKQTDTDPASLEQQLAEARLKIRALETMIDIAEEQLKIDIRKKSGAKQLPK